LTHAVLYPHVKPNLPSFTWLLSVAVPLLCLAVLGSLTTLNYYSLRETSVHGGGVHFHSHQYDFIVPRNEFLSHSLFSSANLVTRPIQALNFPGMFGEAITSMAMRTWPDSYRAESLGPFHDDLFIWRAIVFPFYCLPFWTFAGLGLDGLFESRRLRWPVLLIGTLLCAFFIVITIGVACAGDPRNDDGTAFMWWGFALWIPLIATFPATWIRLGLRCRASKRAGAGSPTSRF